MHIFDGIKREEERRKQEAARQRQLYEETHPNIIENYSIKEESKKEEPKPKTVKDYILAFFNKYIVIWVVLGILLLLGIIWYFSSSGVAGMFFFGFISFLIFALITPTFAKLSDKFEQKFGETKGSTLGCLGMASGLIIAVGFFFGSSTYWDYEKNEEKNYYSSITVYRTPYGDCYHYNPNCYHIVNHKIITTNVYKAEEKGLRPCLDCSY